jgi:AGZA family xanthine/uracil permease-like MFS transporter
MGLNAIVAYQLAARSGSWQTAMGLVVLDGLIVFALVLSGVREAVMRAIPLDLRRAISVGIGLFIALIGAVNARLIVVPAASVSVLSDAPLAVVPPVTHGTLHAPEPLIAVAGLLVTAFLASRRVAGAVVLGIAAATAIALATGVAAWPTAAGWLRWPPFDTIFQADVRSALDWRLLPLVASLVIVDFFDTVGTVTAVADAGGLEHEGRIPHLRRILGIDALAAALGGLFGVSSVTSYVESAAGVAEGARTGLHSVVVATLFTLAIFAAPLAAIVPAAATAPALLVVGYLMCQQLPSIAFREVEIGLPAFLVMIMVPLTYSISHGIGFGFLAYTVIMVLRGRAAAVHPLMYLAAAAFAAYFAFV